MNKKIVIGIVVVILILLFMIFRLGEEDSWIKNNKGIWINHGNPSQTPDYVKEQQQVVTGALQLYYQKKSTGMQFSSQCLGIIGDYAVDIVHVPRNNEDDLDENQCGDFRNGKVSHFIELDKDGNIFRII